MALGKQQNNCNVLLLIKNLVHKQSKCRMPCADYETKMDPALRFQPPTVPNTLSFAPSGHVPQPSSNYFHAESTRGVMAPNSARYNETPRSSVRYEAPFQQAVNRASNAETGAEGKEAQKQTKKIIIIIGILLLLALGIALLIFFLQDKQEDNESPNSSPQSNVQSSFVTEKPVDAMYLQQQQQQQQQYEQQMQLQRKLESANDEQTYYPTPFDTPDRSGTPISEEGVPLNFDVPSGPHQFEPNEAAQLRKHERSNKPPPASWFGADAPTRGSASEEMMLDGELGNQESIAKIYKGKANNVLGGANQAPYAQVNPDVASQVGWAEISDDVAHGDAAEYLDADRIAGGSARSMSELYEASMGPRSNYREGSSLSTVVSPDEAAQRAVARAPERAEQFEEGRARAKQITAESAAAIGGIYAKKRQAAAGMSAAAAKQHSESNDVNFEYYDQYSQKPINSF